MVKRPSGIGDQIQQSRYLHQGTRGEYESQKLVGKIDDPLSMEGC